VDRQGGSRQKLDVPPESDEGKSWKSKKKPVFSTQTHMVKGKRDIGTRRSSTGKACDESPKSKGLRGTTQQTANRADRRANERRGEKTWGNLKRGKQKRRYLVRATQSQWTQWKQQGKKQPDEKEFK